LLKRSFSGFRIDGLVIPIRFNCVFNPYCGVFFLCYFIYFSGVKRLIILLLATSSVCICTAQRTETTEEKTAGAKEEVFIYTEEMPQAMYNVNEYLARKMEYPISALNAGIQGRVVTKFIIDKTGSVDSVVVISSPHPSLAAEALRVVKSMPKWKPGYHKGEPVKVYYTLPINFSMQGGPGEQHMPPLSGPVYTFTDQMPEPGIEVADYIVNNLRISGKFDINDINGKVVYRFIVRSDGYLDSIKVHRSLSPLIDTAVLLLLQSMPEWKPAIHQGRPVNAWFTQPVFFKAQVTGQDTILARPQEIVIDEQPKPLFNLFEFTHRELPYPVRRKANDGIGIKGRVNFIINEDGSISDVAIPKPNHVQLDKDTLELMKTMPKWQPAMYKGMPIKMAYSLNITYLHVIR
jgi:TonB family protein